VKNKAEINLEVTQEVTPVMRAMINKELADLQSEKASWLEERDRLREELGKTQRFLKEAVADAFSQQNSRASEVKQLEHEKAALRQNWIDAMAAAAEAQDSSAMEMTRQREAERAIQAKMEGAELELEMLQKIKDAEIKNLRYELTEQGVLLRERDRQLAALREQAQTNAASVARLEKENNRLCERWLDDVRSLEEEKAAMSNRFENEKAALQRLQAAPRARPPPDVEEVAAATRSAKWGGCSYVADCKNKAAELRESLEVAAADAEKLQERRATRFADLEAEARGLSQKWYQFIQPESEPAPQTPEKIPEERVCGHEDSFTSVGTSSDAALERTPGPSSEDDSPPSVSRRFLPV